jgi:putative ABC transport system substrate-binding protein
MDRRAFMGALAGGLLATPLAAEAQPTGRVWRIGLLSPLFREDPLLEPLLEGLRELGYVQGRNLVLEQRYAGGRREHLSALAEELARLKIDLLVSSGPAATIAGKMVSAKVPVVFVTDGPAANTLTPRGSNLTGMALMPPKMGAKWVELIRDALPEVRRVAILWDPTGTRPQLQSAEVAARSLGLAALSVIGHLAHEIDAAFETAVKQRVGAIIVLPAGSFAFRKQQIIGLSARHRLAAIYGDRDFVQAGGLISYGPDLRDACRRLAAHVDKILKGAKPADLPVEQPTKFELVINLKTARALGLTIPPSVLGRADQVIQ